MVNINLDNTIILKSTIYHEESTLPEAQLTSWKLTPLVSEILEAKFRLFRESSFFQHSQ